MGARHRERVSAKSPPHRSSGSKPFHFVPAPGAFDLDGWKGYGVESMFDEYEQYGMSLSAHIMAECAKELQLLDAMRASGLNWAAMFLRRAVQERAEKIIGFGV